MEVRLSVTLILLLAFQLAACSRKAQLPPDASDLTITAEAIRRELLCAPDGSTKDCLTAEELDERLRALRNMRDAFRDGGTFYWGGYRTDVEVGEDGVRARTTSRGQVINVSRPLPDGGTVLEGDFHGGRPRYRVTEITDGVRLTRTETWDVDGDGIADRELTDVALPGSGKHDMTEVEYDNRRGHRATVKRKWERPAVMF